MKDRTAREKYIHVFGKLGTLAEQVPWTTGVSNMLEWLTWSTNDILGVTKTRYWNKIVDWSHERKDAQRLTKLRYVRQMLDEEMRESEESERHARPRSLIASPREALRRAKYFSEDYLNKEFDIFWSLVSDRYLDAFYGQFTHIRGGGPWSTHGNSGLFANSTGIHEMQMDNLSYNATEALLVANEIKLGGKKNPDQILKYALMFKLLCDRGFIDTRSRFLLHFVSDVDETIDKQKWIETEITHCKRSSKSTARKARQPDVISIAKSAEFASTSWTKLIAFNDAYQSALDSASQQVEQKLLWGFNESLKAKIAIQRRS